MVKKKLVLAVDHENRKVKTSAPYSGLVRVICHSSDGSGFPITVIIMHLKANFRIVSGPYSHKGKNRIYNNFLLPRSV